MLNLWPSRAIYMRLEAGKVCIQPSRLHDSAVSGGETPLTMLPEVEDAKPGAGEPRAGEARRSQRFGLQATLRYRMAGEKAWREGETENISSAGILFRTHSAARTGASLELCVEMPVRNSEGSAEVICRGVVVRSVPDNNGDLPALAVRILHFRLARG